MDIRSGISFIVDRRGYGYTECYVKCPGGIYWLFDVVDVDVDGLHSMYQMAGVEVD